MNNILVYKILECSLLTMHIDQSEQQAFDQAAMFYGTATKFSLNCA